MSIVDPGALEALGAELTAADLPVKDLDEPDRHFFRFEDELGTVGYAGIECIGTDRLLRSLVVKPDRRGSGFGGMILAAIERATAEDGASRLYLLTTTAEAFFRRHGYRSGERAEAPAAIAGTTQFRSLCPASAALLVKRIA